MVAFYPYILSNSTVSCTNKTTLQAAQASAASDTARQNAQGTSLTTGSIIGIIAAVLFLFFGLAWFVYNALVTLSRKKKMLLQEKRQRMRVGRRGDDFV
jgi:beta-lactamase regulating signal transducer with metallopeptidase domain